MRIGNLRRRFDLGLRRPHFAVSDVFGNRASKQHHFLRHDCHLPTNVRELQLGEILPIEFHLAYLHFVKALQQRKDRALAAARCPHKRHAFSRSSDKCHAEQHFMIGS